MKIEKQSIQIPEKIITQKNETLPKDLHQYFEKKE